MEQHTIEIHSDNLRKVLASQRAFLQTSRRYLGLTPQAHAVAETDDHRVPAGPASCAPLAKVQVLHKGCCFRTSGCY